MIVYAGQNISKAWINKIYLCFRWWYTPMDRHIVCSVGRLEWFQVFLPFWVGPIFLRHLHALQCISFAQVATWCKCGRWAVVFKWHYSTYKIKKNIVVFKKNLKWIIEKQHDIPKILINYPATLFFCLFLTFSAIFIYLYILLFYWFVSYMFIYMYFSISM